MKQEEIRHALIEGAIRSIAENGLDKTTTKALATAAGGYNEVYIYRLFDGKEDLLAKAFSTLDEELLQATTKLMPLLSAEDTPLRERFWAAFCSLWMFMHGNRERCLAYIRYYYSSYFEQYSTEEHRLRFESFVNQIRPFFRERANVWMILSYIFTVMMDFTIKIINGSIPDYNERPDDYTEHIFRVIYEAIKQYFKSAESE